MPLRRLSGAGVNHIVIDGFPHSRSEDLRLVPWAWISAHSVASMRPSAAENASKPFDGYNVVACRRQACFLHLMVAMGHAEFLVLSRPARVTSLAQLTWMALLVTCISGCPAVKQDGAQAPHSGSDEHETSESSKICVGHAGDPSTAEWNRVIARSHWTGDLFVYHELPVRRADVTEVVYDTPHSATLRGRLVWLDLNQPAARALLPKVSAPITVSLGAKALGDQTLLAQLESMAHDCPVGLRVNGTDLRDADLAQIGSVGHLRMLDVSLHKISASALAHINGLTELRMLNLWDTDVTDDGLAHLAPLTQLRELRLGREITDAGISHLTRLAQLRELDIKQTKVTGPGMVHLKSLPELRPPRSRISSWGRCVDPSRSARAIAAAHARRQRQLGRFGPPQATRRATRADAREPSHGSWFGPHRRPDRAAQTRPR